MKKNSKKTPMKEKKETPVRLREHALNFRVLLVIWGTVLALMIVAFIIGHYAIGYTTYSTAAFPLIAAITSFSAFVVQSIFSFAVVNHNDMIRKQSAELKKNNTDTNARSEAFRKLQFIGEHYTVVDFVDYVLLYEEHLQYTDQLKSSHDFSFYLKEEGISEEDILANFDQYRFITIKMPMKIVEGKTVGKIKYSAFKFKREGREYRFLPCMGNNESLILFNEIDHRTEVIVNLIMRRDSEFFMPNQLNPFSKIKISLSMHSLLGVAIKGAIELYFTNPEQTEISGANKYPILSSHFEIDGLPILTHNNLGGVRGYCNDNWHI